MDYHCKYDELADSKELKSKFHPKNRNKHPDDQIDRLVKILEYQGWRYAVKISKRSDKITSGHGRVLAAEKLKCKVPVVYQDYKSDEQEYADVQADNAIASWAELDLSGINTDIGELGPDFDIDLLGIKDFEIEPADKFQDAVPEEPKKARTKTGDLYELGNHRLLCGDATVDSMVSLLLADQKIDMVFTDPPYGFGYEGDFYQKPDGIRTSSKNKQYKPLENDTGLWDFDASVILNRFNNCDEIFLWGADYYCWTLPKYGSWICWNKIGENQNFDNIPGASFELCWSKSKHKRHLIGLTWRGAFGHNKKIDGDKKVHPTQKPVKLAEWFFEKWGNEKVNIVDLFGGSGSTLIACEKTKRKCFMMEIEPKYCDVIVSRWVKFTGINQIKRNGEPVVWQDQD